MKKVLILGSSGILGSALVRAFSTDYHVISGVKDAFDITNYAVLEKNIYQSESDVIINAAAFNGVDLTEENADAYQAAEAINGEAVGNLAKLSAQENIPLVHFSTDYVFDGENVEGYAEEAAPAPLNKYGHTKFLGERLLQENTNQYYLVRLSRLFGHHGASARAKKSFVDIMIDLAEKQGKKELKLVDEEISSPTYSVDLARRVRQLVAGQYPYGIYHGANSGSCSWYGLAKKIFELKQLPVKLTPILSSEYPRPAKRPLHSVLLNTKLPPARSWQEALTEYAT
ncbi:MAG: dTDP-4-dehydrorhamnose reductase [Candidatus Magasanikbacteria bacterium]|nr:dTDP-4-dehydrorhamnose reductase [Candidatus Magasanikbacteria bacterium]